MEVRLDQIYRKEKEVGVVEMLLEIQSNLGEFIWPKIVLFVQGFELKDFIFFWHVRLSKVNYGQHFWRNGEIDV